VGSVGEQLVLALVMLAKLLGSAIGASVASVSLHALRSASGRNPQQRFSLVLAAFVPTRFAVGCYRLQPRGSIKAPSIVVSFAYEGRDVADSGDSASDEIGAGCRVAVVERGAGGPLI